MNIFEMLKITDIVGYWETAVKNNPLSRWPLFSLFPVEKQVGNSLAFIKGANNKPVLLRASAFDAMPPIRGRLSRELRQLEMPLFREEIPVKEKDLQNLMTYAKLGGSQLNAALESIYRDDANLIEGARATRARMIGQAMSTGAIALSNAENDGASVVVDFGFNATTQKTTLTTTALWSAPTTATPITNLMAAQARAGGGSVVAYMTKQTFSELLACAEVKNNVYLAAYTGIVNPVDVKNWFVSHGITISVVDDGDWESSVLDVDGNSIALFPDGYVTVAPKTTLGNMVFGTTTEEAALEAGLSDVKSVAVVDRGVAVVSKLKDDGFPTKSTIVSQICLPSFTQVAKIQIIVV